MTRSHKHNDRDHAGLADGTADENEHLPRYFAKTGHSDTDPNKTKKNGGGKGNWGREGDEIEDYTCNLTNPRRRSNSSAHTDLKDFKTKFETVEPEPVFEEELHGAQPVIGEDLDKASTASSSATSAGSIDDDGDLNKKL